jgi:hypothetical protein
MLELAFRASCAKEYHMNLGSSAADLGLMVLLLFPALLAPALLIGIGVLLARILHLPGIVALLFAIGSVGILLIAGSLLLDQRGQTIPALVERRSELVDLRPQGDWRHELSVQVRYRLDGGAPVADQPVFDESATTLTLPPAHFDRLSEGGETTVRVLPLFRSLALVRLGDLSTLDTFPWLWIGLAPVLLLLLWFAGRLMSSRIGALLVIIVVVGGAITIPSLLAYRQWQASEDLASRPLRTTAQLRSVTRITQVDPFPCTPGSGSRCGRRNTKFDVAQPYDIVQLSYVPEGAGGQVIAVDAIDAPSGDILNLAPGASIEIAYAPDAPRSAQILGTTHTHYWRNALGFVMLTGALALLLALGLWWIIQRTGRTRQQRSVNPAHPVNGA